MRFYMEEIAPAEENLDNKSESSEISNKNKLIESIYSKGRVGVISLLLAIGLAKDVPVADEEEPKYITESFANVSKDKVAEVSSVLNKIFNQDELQEFLNGYFPLDGDGENLLPALLLEEEGQKAIIELDGLYNITPSTFFYAFYDEKEERGFVESLQNPAYKKIIKEIRDYFPDGYKPDAEFLPLGHMESLQDHDYIEGLKLMAEIKMEGYYISNNYRQITSLTRTSPEYKVFQKLTNLGAQLNVGIFSFFRYETRVGENAEEVDKFIETNPNAKALAYSGGVSIGESELLKLMRDTTGYWLDFFSNEKNQENINYLKEHGYTFNSFLSLDKKYTKYIQNNSFIDFARLIAEKLSPEFIQSSRTGMMFDEISTYYDFNNPIEMESLEADLNQRPGKNLSMEDLETTFAPKKEVLENIFNPLVSETDFSQRRPENFLSDPALEIVYRLKYNNKERLPRFLKEMDDRQQSEWIMRVCRNMHVQGLDATEENFEKVFNESLSLRMSPEILNQDLFKDRNVAFFAHNERWAQSDSYGIKGEKRFGKDASVEGLKGQKVRDLNVFQADNTTASLKETKENFLNYVASHDKLTILIDAHGSEYGFYLTSGVPDQDGKISLENLDQYVSVEDLANTLEKRFDNGHRDAPIILESACLSQNFIRNLYANLSELNISKNKQIPLPIAAGVSEYGQFGFSEGGAYGDTFLEALLSKNRTAKIKDIVLLEEGTMEKMNSNISLFVPLIIKKTTGNEKKKSGDRYYQIAKTDPRLIQNIFDNQYINDLQAGKFDNTTASYYEAAQPDRAKKIKEILEKKKEETS